MKYKLRWSKGQHGWETSFGKFHISIQEDGFVDISDSPYYLNFTRYPSFEAAGPTIKTLMFEDQIQEVDNFTNSGFFKRIYGKFP
jgi:hypothetical protein